MPDVRPPIRELLGVIEVSGRRNVIHERVEPHIYDMLFVARNRNPPFECCTAYGLVAYSAFEEAHYLVVTGFRHYGLEMGLVILNELRYIL